MFYVGQQIEYYGERATIKRPYERGIKDAWFFTMDNAPHYEKADYERNFKPIVTGPDRIAEMFA